MGDALSVPFIVSWQESILGVLDNPRVIVITIKTSKLRLDVNKIECTKFILILLLQTAELTYAGKAVLVRCRQAGIEMQCTLWHHIRVLEGYVWLYPWVIIGLNLPVVVLNAQDQVIALSSLESSDLFGWWWRIHCLPTTHLKNKTKINFFDSF